MDLAFPFLFPAGGEAALAGKRGTAHSALSLALAQERPEPDLMCSFAPSMSESCCATLSRRDGWEGKGLFSPVCPEKPSALGCAWHEQRVALGVAAMADFSWACCAWLGLCSAESSLPAAPVGNKSPTNCQQRSKKTVGRAGGSQSQLPLSMVASSVVTVTSGNTANLLCLFLCQVRGELSGRPSWKVRPSSPC